MSTIIRKPSSRLWKIGFFLCILFIGGYNSEFVRSIYSQYPTYFSLSVGFILMMLVYRVYFGVNYALTFDNFERKSLAFEAKRRKMFPPPYPNSWYRLLDSADVKPGQIRALSCLGRDIVVFRTQSGQCGVLDAFCPHLGAHLKDGKVQGDTLVCPFHRWAFEISGKCVDIPYTTCKVPNAAKTKSYHVVERARQIWMWFDAEDRPPQWQLTIPEYIENGSYYYGGVTQMEFDQYISEMAENSADPHHFNTLHAPLPLPLLNRFLNLRHEVELTFDSDPNKSHLCYFKEHATLYLLDSIKLYPKQTQELYFDGASIVHFHFNTIFGRIHMIKTILPLAAFHQYTEDRWFAQSTVPRWFGWLLAVIARNALEQDRTVWESKIYRKKPLLVQNDGPFHLHRRWYRQFYSENSKNLSQSLMEW